MVAPHDADLPLGGAEMLLAAVCFVCSKAHTTHRFWCGGVDIDDTISRGIGWQRESG